MKTYRITTASGNTVFVDADRVVLEDNRVTLYVGDDPVGRFVGASSFGVHQPTPLPD